MRLHKVIDACFYHGGIAAFEDDKDKNRKCHHFPEEQENEAVSHNAYAYKRKMDQDEGN